MGGAAKVAGAGVKGLAGAATGAAAGLTGSKQTVDWAGGKSTEKASLADDTPTKPAFQPRAEKKYGTIGDHALISVSASVDEDEEETLKKSTDIFKRVLEAERPDETWTGTDKEKPMEKIIGLLAAPIAGAIGSAVGAGLSTVGGIAGGAAKKLIGG